MTDASERGKVFLSHTSEMAKYPHGRSFVQAAKDAVNEAGFLSDDMQDFPAASMSPVELDTKRLLECDIYLGILGFRFGMPVRDQPQLSYTQHEFRTAKEAGKTHLVFLLDQNAEGLPGSVFRDDEFQSQQDAFRQEVLNLDGQGLVCQFFKSADELHRLIVRALKHLQPPPIAKDRTPQLLAAWHTHTQQQWKKHWSDGSSAKKP